MKKYKIYGFESHGTFYCREEFSQGNENLLLIGKFDNKGKERTFVKNDNDIELI